VAQRLLGRRSRDFAAAMVVLVAAVEQLETDDRTVRLDSAEQRHEVER
jgi:hypothetical protein